MGDVFEVHQIGNLTQRLARVVEQGDQFEGGIELNPLRSRQSRHRAAHLREILRRDAKTVGIPAHLAFRKHILLHQCEEAQEETCCKIGGLHLRQAMLADRPEVEEENLHHPAQHFALEGRLGLGQSAAEERKIGLHQPQSLVIEGNRGIDADKDEALRSPDHLGIVLLEERGRSQQKFGLEIVGIGNILDGIGHLPDGQVALSRTEGAFAIGEGHRAPLHQDMYMIVGDEVGGHPSIGRRADKIASVK